MAIRHRLRYNQHPILTSVHLGTGGGTVPGGGGGGPGIVAPLTAVGTFDTHRNFNRTVRTGTPTNFNSNYNKGYSSKVKVTVTASQAVSGGSVLFMRLHDALDPASLITGTGNGAGTGRVLQTTIPVPNLTSLPASATTANLTIGAIKAWNYVDLSLSADMSNAQRITIPFGVGSNIFGWGTSHMGAFFTSFQYQVDFNDPTAVAPTPLIAHYSPYTAFYIAAQDDATASPWYAPDNLPSTVYYSPGAAELTGRLADTLGVNVALVGNPGFGGSLMDQSIYDTAGHHWWGVTQRAMRHMDWDFDAIIAIAGANDYSFNHSRHWITHKVNQVHEGIDAQFVGSNPYVAVYNCTPQWGGHDNSTGFRPGALALRDVTSTKVGWLNHLWMDSGGGGSGAYQAHESPLDKVREGRQWYRYIAGAMGAIPLRQGPQIISAVRSGTVITLNIQHDGGTTLRPAEWFENQPPNNVMQENTLATSVQMANLFSLYSPGETWNYATGGKIALASTNPVVLGTNTITLNLASAPSVNVGIDLFYGWDMEGIAGAWPGWCACITDDVTDAIDGMPFGRPMRRTLDPIYIPPPTPLAQSLTINQPLDTAVGSWILLSGGGQGLPLAGSGTDAPVTSIEVQLGSGSWQVPSQCIIRNSMVWSAFLKAPSTPQAALALNVRRAGQTIADASTTVNIVAVRDIYPASFKASIVAGWNANNISTLWQDNNRSVPTTEMSIVSAWDDQFGTASNTVKQLMYPGVSQHAPVYDQRVRTMSDGAGPTSGRNYTGSDRSAVFFEDGAHQLLSALNPAVLSTLVGSFTIVVAGRPFGAQYIATGYLQPNYGPPYYGTGGQFQNSVQLSDSYFGRSGNTGTGGNNSYSPQHGIFMTYTVFRYDNTTGIATLWTTGNNTNSPTWRIVTSTSPCVDLSPLANLNYLYIGAGLQYFSPVYSGHNRINEMFVCNRTLTDTEITNDLLPYMQVRWPW